MWLAYFGCEGRSRQVVSPSSGACELAITTLTQTTMQESRKERVLQRVIKVCILLAVYPTIGQEENESLPPHALVGRRATKRCATHNL